MLHPQQEHEHGGQLLSSSSEHGEVTCHVSAMDSVSSLGGGSPLQATPVPRQVLPHPTSPNKQPPPQLQLQDPGHSAGPAQHSPWSATPRPLHQPASQVSPGPVQGCLGTVLSDKHKQLLLLLSLCLSVFSCVLLLGAVSKHEPCYSCCRRFAMTCSCALLQGGGLTPAVQDHQALHQVNVVRLQQELQQAAGDLEVRFLCIRRLSAARGRPTAVCATRCCWTGL